jgi:hypothetical protein
MSSEDALRVAAAHRSRDPPSPTFGEQPLIDQLILKLLHKKPDTRYQTGIPEIRRC